MCRMTLMQHYTYDLFDTYDTYATTCPLLCIKFTLICNLSHPLGSLLAKFEFAAVISPVTVADKANSDDFDL